MAPTSSTPTEGFQETLYDIVVQSNLIHRNAQHCTTRGASISDAFVTSVWEYDGGIYVDGFNNRTGQYGLAVRASVSVDVHGLSLLSAFRMACTDVPHCRTKRSVNQQDY